MKAGSQFFFACEALLAVSISVAHWLIKLWSMATPIKLIFFISVGRSNFGSEKLSNKFGLAFVYNKLTH